MQRIIATVTLLFSLSSVAQIESMIKFKGQNAETVKLQKKVSITRSQAYEANTTCTRQIPREVYECNDVTRYRNECSWVPTAQNCWNENENVCRSVTRTREECSNGSSRRVCTDDPTREVCTDRPSREVCVERPTREVCRTRSDGTQSCQTVGGGESCQTVGGGQSCHTVGGGQSCHDEEGPRVCRSVNYPDQECTTVSHQRCETIPAHNDCRDIPYSEQVCGNVTRYDNEEYACTETRSRDVVMEKNLSGILNVQFLTNGFVEEFPMNVGVAALAQDHKEFKVLAKLVKEPVVLVILKKSNVKVLSESDKEINIEGLLVLEIIDPKMIAPSFPVSLNNVEVNEQTHEVKMNIEGSLSATGSVEAALSAKSFLASRKNIAELKANYPSNRATVEGVQMLLNLKDLVARDLKKKMQIDIKLSAPLGIPGEVLNIKKPITEKSYENLKVKLN